MLLAVLLQVAALIAFVVFVTLVADARWGLGAAALSMMVAGLVLEHGQHQSTPAEGG